MSLSIPKKIQQRKKSRNDSHVHDENSDENSDEDQVAEEFQGEQKDSSNAELAFVKDEDGKNSLPSLKATLKDRTKNASMIEQQHKMQLLVEILRLLQIYKAHSVKNKFQQWAMVQDALEKQDTGSQYKRMEKSYCFRKKVLTAVYTWIDWAKARGYPDPEALRKHPSHTWKFPSFLELMYKTYNETKDTERHHGSKKNNDIHFSDEKKDDENPSEIPPETNQDEKRKEIASFPSLPEQQENRHPKQSKPSETLYDDSNSDPDDVMQVASVIQAVNTQASIAATTVSSNGSLNSYLKSVASVQKEKARILSLKRSALQAELQDLDLQRLERIEDKLSTFTPGSTLFKEYSRQKKFIISRLAQSE